MKKFLSLIIGLLLINCLFSCTEEKTTVTTDQFVPMYSHKFTFEEHDYIRFKDNTNPYSGGVVHDPNCKKCKEKKEHENIKEDDNENNYYFGGW